MNILAEIQREWDIAEEEIKRCEQISLKASFPAIKELRYAGRRLVDALNAAASGKTVTEVQPFLEDARFDCQRARHDAIDAALDTIAVDFDLMVKRLGFDAVIKGYPTFPTLYADFSRARAKIANSRGDRENRTAIYDSIANIDFHSIADRYADLATCRPIILAYAAKARLQQIGWWVMLGVTLVSLAFAAMSYRDSHEMRKMQEYAPKIVN